MQVQYGAGVKKTQKTYTFDKVQHSEARRGE